MEQELKLDLDGVSYTMTPANAMSSWMALKNAMKLAQGLSLSGVFGKDKQQAGAELLQGVLANLGTPEVKALEDIVLKHTVCSLDGKNYRLSDNPDKHFNQYRHHLIPILVQGVKYQFGDFFNVGGMLQGFMKA